jgi:hypothetical protein
MSETNRIQVNASVNIRSAEKLGLVDEETLDLRTRIAAALERADKEPQPFDQGPVGYEYLADAVIRELGLTCERLGESTGYPHPQTRYVTEWSDDE